MAGTDRMEPLLTGRRVTYRDLEAEFGPCAGMVLGYGEGEFGGDGKLRWCAAVVPNDIVPRFINARHAAGQRGPFLIGMGSFKRAVQRGGVGEALYGVALVADASLPARDLLWPDQLQRSDAVKPGNEFRWPNGVPFLRVWLCERPMLFVELTGVQPAFQRHHGIRVVPLDEVVPGLAHAISGVPLRAAVLDRPLPLPPAIAATVEVREGALKYRLTGGRERDTAVVADALRGNALRYGVLTCEDCGYRPADDARVPRGYARGMLEVHHVEPLARGERVSRRSDLVVLCPMCHRRTHLLQRVAGKETAAHAAGAVRL